MPLLLHSWFSSERDTVKAELRVACKRVHLGLPSPWLRALAHRSHLRVESDALKSGLFSSKLQARHRQHATAQPVSDAQRSENGRGGLQPLTSLPCEPVASAAWTEGRQRSECPSSTVHRAGAAICPSSSRCKQVPLAGKTKPEARTVIISGQFTLSSKEEPVASRQKAPVTQCRPSPALRRE